MENIIILEAYSLGVEEGEIPLFIKNLESL